MEIKFENGFIINRGKSDNYYICKFSLLKEIDRTVPKEFQTHFTQNSEFYWPITNYYDNRGYFCLDNPLMSNSIFRRKIAINKF